MSSSIGKAILYYGYILTLPMEIDRYWRAGSFTWASIVFLANRYIAVLGHVPFFYRILTSPCKTLVGLICFHSVSVSFTLPQAHVSTTS